MTQNNHAQPMPTFEYNSNSNQQLLLSTNAHVLESDDTIFVTKPFRDHSILSNNPFLESIWDELQKLELGDNDLTFTSVETVISAQKLSLYYSFSKVIFNNEIAILCSIIDSTNAYQVNYQIQQLQYNKILKYN